MMQRKRALMFVFLVVAVFGSAMTLSAQETATADQYGNFNGETVFDSTNCSGKLTVEILKDGDGVEMSANVTVDTLKVSSVGSAILVTFRGTLTDNTKSGTFWIKVTKECLSTTTVFKRCVIISPAPRR